MTDTFVGGLALQNPEFARSVEYLATKGVTYPKFVTDAIQNQAVSITDPFYYNSKAFERVLVEQAGSKVTHIPKKVVFNKRHFTSFKELDAAYPCGKNYTGVEKYPEQAELLISNLLKFKVIRKLKPSEILENGRVFNPINVVLSGKFRLILHPKTNVYYTHPAITLPRITTHTNVLRKAHSMVVHDLSNAYYQLALTKESSLLLSFFYKGEHYEFLCLVFGCSSSVIINQTIFGIPADVARVRDQATIYHYIDDYTEPMLSPDSVDHILPELKKHGLLLSDKSVRSTTVEFLGIFLDLANNNMTLKPKTAQKLYHRLCQSFTRNGLLYFTTEDMEELHFAFKI